jgi:hypothetical protein
MIQNSYLELSKIIHVLPCYRSGYLTPYSVVNSAYYIICQDAALLSTYNAMTVRSLLPTYIF